MTEHLPPVTMTTDGAARGNPGPGGWAALLESSGREQLLSGEEPGLTTNNAMELYAVVAALEALKRPCRVTIRADSQYVLEGIERLMAGGALPEKNRSLWKRLAGLLQQHRIELAWVRGHSGDPRNERVDAAANAAAGRAYARAEDQRPPATDAPVWRLVLCSPSAERPVRWALLAPHSHRAGDVPVAGVTQPTAVYQALVQGLAAAQEIPGAEATTIEVFSNYELIIKQGRGEWKVKNPNQQALAAQAAQLRRAFGDVRYTFGTTEQVMQLLDPPQSSNIDPVR